MSGDVSLDIMNDSDSHIQLKDHMVVDMGQDALHIEYVFAEDGLLKNGIGRSAIENMLNCYFHLEAIIGLGREDNPLPTRNSGTISKVKRDENFQEMTSKSGELNSN